MPGVRISAGTLQMLNDYQRRVTAGVLLLVTAGIQLTAAVYMEYTIVIAYSILITLVLVSDAIILAPNIPNNPLELFNKSLNN